MSAYACSMAAVSCHTSAVGVTTRSNGGSAVLGAELQLEWRRMWAQHLFSDRTTMGTRMWRELRLLMRTTMEVLTKGATNMSLSQVMTMRALA